MTKKREIDGDKHSFIKSWIKRKEITYNHWTKKYPENQVQLAFKNHWEVFRGLLDNKLFNKGNRCLEVGCGRGSISSYFSEAGYDCTLLDISPEVINSAKKIFKKNKLKAKFYVGDANLLPFKDNSFDIIVSIGLLEHFEDVEKTISEQIRVLDKGGIFIGYVVPKYIKNIQNEYNWINDILKIYAGKVNKIEKKEKLFRSDKSSSFYKKYLKKFDLKGISSSGIYSMPMISHSIEFPFTLMPKEAEKIFVDNFKTILDKKNNKNHPWLCKEGFGQAFIIWDFK